ncbi:vWA domain-containing protein [Adlercreutzia caecimuris]|uniref:VWA-like domain-containing protein n=1 Tax=Adlercreutzia caecimuris TaxID=671266 RepID=A0A4S4G2K0_9ACTN|nr:VWA-like domain-containing protein [Adlercreutzia caecimuris]THG36725.1 hypothetical protein E5986_09000 [Adlercreutzia caecimuris]
MIPEDGIVSLHDRIRREIDEIDLSDSRQRTRIRCDFEELFDLIKLFLIAERDVYYGYALMAMRLEVDFEDSIVAGIKLNAYPPVLKINPLRLGVFSLKELLYIVCHEIDHVVFNHPAEMIRLNPGGNPAKYELFNLAADASVNDRLNFEVDRGQSYMRMPQGAVTSLSLGRQFGLNDIMSLQSYRYYYDLLLNSLSEEEMAALDASHEQRGSVSPLQGVPAPDAGDGGNSTEGSSDFGSATEAGAGSSEANSFAADHDWAASADDYEAAQAEVREFLNAVDSLMGDDARGNMPGHYASQLERLNAPPIVPWQVVLKRYIGTIESGYRKTRSRLNRRQPKRFDLSGSTRTRELNIVVAIDVSGSVSNRELENFFSEVFAILARSSQPITIIECDMVVQRVYEATKVGDVHLDVRGRGGTAFSPVVEYVNSNRGYRDALLIFFTDGFGEREIPQPHTYRNLWVVLNDADNLSVKNPYGSVVAMKD